MEADSVIEWFDWLLFLSGGKLYAKTPIIFYANWTIKLLNAIAYLLMMFADSIFPTAFNYNEVSVVQWMADKGNALLALSFSVTLTYYGGQVTDLLEDILSSVREENKYQIKKFATLVSFCGFLVVTAMAVSGIILDVQSSDSSAAEVLMGVIITGFISLNNWFVNASILYVIVVLSLTHRQVMQLREVSSRITTPGKLESVLLQKLLSQRKHIHFLVFEINRLIGFCPLFMFGYMFLLTPALIMDLKGNTDVAGIVMEVLTIIIAFTCIIMLLVIVHNFYAKSQDAAHDVIERVYAVKEYELRLQDLIYELDISKVRLTAWSLFEVKEQLFVSYMSAIITFTVLFNQLDIKSLKQAVEANSTAVTTS